MIKKRILVVEDETIVAADLQARLRDLGYDPAGLVTAGEAALAEAEAMEADIVLMDIQLKGRVDGIEAAEQIRKKLGIPVVFLTAHIDEATFQRARITAPFGYVRKPFDERELHTALEIALYRHATETQLKKTQQWLEIIIESVDTALVVTDKWGLIELMNSAAGTLSGWPPEEAILKPLAEVFRLQDASTHEPVHVPLGSDFDLQPRQHWRFPIMLQKLGGASLLVDYTVSAIRDEGGGVTGLVWLFTSSPAGVPREGPGVAESVAFGGGESLEFK